MTDVIPAHLVQGAPNAAVIEGEVQASGDAAWVLDSPSGKLFEVRVTGPLVIVLEDGAEVMRDSHAVKNHSARECAELKIKIALMEGFILRAGPKVAPLSPMELLQLMFS